MLFDQMENSQRWRTTTPKEYKKKKHSESADPRCNLFEECKTV